MLMQVVLALGYYTIIQVLLRGLTTLFYAYMLWQMNRESASHFIEEIVESLATVVSEQRYK
jgi:membrane-bound ClpP family serine protease